MKFSFVIPAYNNYKLLHQLLWDIYKNCSKPYEVIVTDDGTDQETVDGLAWWKDSELLPVKHFRHKPLGFLKNSNYGLNIAGGDIVALVSTDVRIHGDLVSSGINVVPNFDDEKYLFGGKVYWESTGWNEFNKKIYPYVEGWLLCATKENWEELGYFDERFSPNDFEDVDLSTTALSLGYTLAQFVPNLTTHIGAQSIPYGPEREELTKINRDKFRKKWVDK